jgi:hypothetical protein
MYFFYAPVVPYTFIHEILFSGKNKESFGNLLFLLKALHLHAFTTQNRVMVLFGLAQLDNTRPLADVSNTQWEPGTKKFISQLKPVT